jgi:endonuclease/exonuclease/phosphatase family metal-dependent hydrolase
MESAAVVSGTDGSVLRVLTHNVWCHYPASLKPSWRGAAETMPGYAFAARLHLLADHIASAGYDVVAVQELFLYRLWPLADGDGNFNLFAERMANVGLIHRTDPKKSLHDDRWVGQNSGVAIFSRFEVLRTASVDFAVSAERNNTKGFVVVDVAVPAQTGSSATCTVRVMCAHLDSMNWPAKSAQVKQLADHVVAARQAAAVDAEVLVGDLNICPQPVYDDGANYRYLAEEMTRAGLQCARGDAVPLSTFVGDVEQTLDHVFVSPTAFGAAGAATPMQYDVVRVRNDDGVTASDHFGVSFTVRLSPRH